MNRDLQKHTELKWHPDGVHFLGPEEAKFRREILSQFESFFSKKGFQEVFLPSFDFSASFEHHVVSSERAKILKARDIQGIELSPSLDLTVQVVKGLAGYASELKASSKVFYFGKIFRDKPKGDGSRRETLQFGAEILGHSNGNTFKLLLSLIHSFLLEIGFSSPVTIVLGNMKIVQKILDLFQLDELESERFLELLYTKNLPFLREFLEKKNLNSFISFLETLILGVNDADDLIRLVETFNYQHKLGLEDCLDETSDILAYSKKHLSKIDLCLDYSFVRDIDYYTGFVFYGFADRESNPFVMGGAYDNLFERFSGVHKNACGLAFQIDTLEELLKK
ncbi:MAG: ATP phosphoribosyltransferase regulatory subunit [Leptospiraceae bacterium]|nr:ATP phosphoribosyltransferase regulatory subunit [Leptospiraceae bacterium]